MSDVQSFNEWMKGRPAVRKPSRKPSVKNPAIDTFLKSVDNLKKDMEELDAIEKAPKVKPEEKKEDKPKPGDKKEKEKEIDSFKSYKKKRDSEEGEPDENDELEDDREDDIRPEPNRDRPRKPVRLPPDRKVPVNSQGLGRKPNRPLSIDRKRLEG